MIHQGIVSTTNPYSMVFGMANLCALAAMANRRTVFGPTMWVVHVIKAIQLYMIFGIHVYYYILCLYAFELCTHLPGVKNQKNIWSKRPFCSETSNRRFDPSLGMDRRWESFPIVANPGTTRCCWVFLHRSSPKETKKNGNLENIWGKRSSGNILERLFYFSGVAI